MRDRFLRSAITVAIAASAVGAVGTAQPASSPSSATAQQAVPRTLWGEPDLQGIWTDETDTPLQRSPKFANQEFFTDAQRAELDRQRVGPAGSRAARGARHRCRRRRRL